MFYILIRVERYHDVMVDVMVTQNLIDISARNGCLQSNCDPNASCRNGPSGWGCTCNCGYEGDGSTCTQLE